MAPFLPGTWLTPHQGWYFAIPSKQRKSSLREDEAGNACWKGCALLFGARRGRWSCREPSPQPDPPLGSLHGLGALVALACRQVYSLIAPVTDYLAVITMMDRSS